MKLIDAQDIIRQVDGKSYDYMKSWGLSLIRESIHTIRSRKSSTIADLQIAENLMTKILREW